MCCIPMTSMKTKSNELCSLHLFLFSYFGSSLKRYNALDNSCSNTHTIGSGVSQTIGGMGSQDIRGGGCVNNTASDMMHPSIMRNRELSYLSTSSLLSLDIVRLCPRIYKDVTKSLHAIRLSANTELVDGLSEDISPMYTNIYEQRPLNSVKLIVICMQPAVLGTA